MKNIWCIFLGSILLLPSCKKEEKGLTVGDWWAKMEVSSKKILPFNFTLSKNDDFGYVIKIYNADEVVVVDEIEVKTDSIRIFMPVFEGYVAGTFTDKEIKGSFIKESLGRSVPFYAVYGKRGRFEASEQPTVDISGIWETQFGVGTAYEYPAKGIFVQNDHIVKGTFRTTTGDYRYLEGVVDADTLKLSTFDGAHAFLFTALVTDSTMQGHFYSGNHSVEKFVAKRNEAFELPEPDSLTYLKEGHDRFDFSFPDMTGNTVSLSDDRFKGKVVLVQIMGTWCPNCLDETRFYVDFLKKNPELDIEFVALAFEYAKTQKSALERIARLKKRVGVEYPILLAQYGTSNKQKANEKLPMLNHVLSYPTTIYIDKKGGVHKIHTGFNGPATGEKYEEFKRTFNETIKKLSEEETETE